MKNGKLAALLNTPARLVIAVGLLILLGEFLVMVLFEGAYNALPKDTFLKGVAFEFIDPLLLAILVSPALILLIFKPMRKQQDKLEDAHKKIRQAFQEWASALDAVDDPIFLHDQDFRILRCNKAYQQCAGIPFKQIIGQPYYAVFPKAAGPLPCCLQALEKAEEDEEEILVGEAVYRSRAFSIHDEQGIYLYSVHTLEDITERKQAWETITKKEENFHALFDAIPDTVFITSMDGRFLSANHSACKRLGYSQEELLQMGPADIDTPEYAAKVPERIKALQERGELVFESAHVRKDGIVIPIELSNRIIDYDGKPVIIGVARDITERKQTESVLRDSEEQYRTMIENSNDLIWTLAPDGSFTFINQQAAEVTGYSIQDWLGKSFAPLVLEEDLPMTLEIHGKIMGGEKAHYEVRGKKADGSILTLSVNASPIFKNGKVSGTISFARDITERKQADARLAEQMEELRAWHDVTLGREMRILELKHEVDELLGASGQPPRYPSAESDDQQEK